MNTWILLSLILSVLLAGFGMGMMYATRKRDAYWMKELDLLVERWRVEDATDSEHTLP